MSIYYPQASNDIQKFFFPSFFKVKIIYSRPLLWMLRISSLFVLLKCKNVCRADRHMPTYAKKIVDLYNQNGQIEKMISDKL